MTKEPLRSRVIEADFFQKVGYSTVWEDERIVEEGLASRPGETALSITSGGDFSLQFLVRDAAEVHSLDFNPRQNFLLEFKRAAVLRLGHGELWRLLGLAPESDRRRLYERVRPGLPDEALRYWDGQPAAVEAGVLRAGKQDRFFHRAGRVLTLLQGRAKVRRYFALTDPEEQRRYFAAAWNGPAWRLLCDALFSRTLLDFAFHKDHFRYAVEGHPGPRIRAQFDRILRDVPASTNFYLYWAFYGTYPGVENCPAWLRASNFDRLRARLGRLQVHTGELERFIFARPDASIDCFNFSNIFDWVTEEAFSRLMREVVRVARPGARLCYWTNIVNTKRELSKAGVSELHEDHDLARRVHAAARTPGYSSCTVARVDAKA
ncbi:MAG: DUF3419 family protein [Planctomycetes bacterium]|nr:DUF3419 family protein [Planctomycetota bacterium]